MPKIETVRQLAKEPDLIRTLQEREPGKSWFDSKTLQFTDVFTEVDQKYAPNYKRENTARAKETIENACELLNDYGGDLVENDNTVEQRILKLEDKAGVLQEKLQSQNKAEREAALKESRQVLGEYIKLSVTDKEKLYDDVPWKSANAAAKSGEKAPVIRKITAEPEDAETIMEAVSERNLGALSQFLHDKKKEGAIREADLSPERPQQEERERVSDPYEMGMDRDDDLII